MSAEEIRAYEHRWFEVMNKGKAAVITALSEYFAPSFVFHSPIGRDLRGLKELEQFFSGLYDGFPDIQYTLNDVVVERDKAVVRWTWTGTHSGAFMGIPPTNKKMTFWELEIHRFIGGKQVSRVSCSSCLAGIHLPCVDWFSRYENPFLVISVSI